MGGRAQQEWNKDFPGMSYHEAATAGKHGGVCFLQGQSPSVTDEETEPKEVGWPTRHHSQRVHGPNFPSSGENSFLVPTLACPQ